MEDRGEKESQEVTACVGLDWADEKHDFKLQAPGWPEPEGGEVKHTSESLIEWVGLLRQRFPEGKIAIALEQSRGALAYLLMRFDFVILYFINPDRPRKDSILHVEDREVIKVHFFLSMNRHDVITRTGLLPDPIQDPWIHEGYSISAG